MTTQSKISEKSVFKDWKPRNNKIINDLETKEKLKKSTVETIQQMHATSPTPNILAIASRNGLQVGWDAKFNKLVD